jgi:RNA polymerase sigma-B factor
LSVSPLNGVSNTSSVSTSGLVGSLPPLTSEERKARTAELLARAQEVSGAERDELLDEVIVLNIPVARSLAARYRNRGQSLEELEQVACLALTRSVQAFNPDRGDDLLVFAVPSILGELKRHFRDASWSVRPPRRVQELRPRLAEAEEQLTQELGRSPSIAELAAELGCPEHEVEEAKSCGDLARSSSLDEPVAESGGTLAELLPVTEPGFDHSEAVAILAPACRRLKRRDRWILQMRFYDQMTQQEIADELGVTQVQVSRLLQRILTDLRRAIGAERQAKAA